ncbi:MAG: malto-oligosyltrehalose synthase [Actinomycetota bacterium]|nr:malto-oligosyltrehalose synthase [Actinomycetota bacterium]
MSPEVRATYRVQLHKGFGFRHAADIVPYLAQLGISHLYCSPYLQARPGSTHGYDVVDQRKINEELGGAEGHRHLCETLAAHGMGHVLDVVPNHMTVTDRANEWWWDVLKFGRQSHYATYFDIDWDPPESKLLRVILIPILGDHYGRVLQAGDLKLEREGDDLVVRYYEHVLPVAPGSVESDDLGQLNSRPELLHEVLERQHYRLAFWRAAGQELNYRRFFSINDLAALRMDNPDVFDRVHELVLEMVRDGRLDGLRIDHIDGLRDPEGHLTQLRSWAPDAYIIVEKILEPEEELRTTWPVQGTTGYDFLNRVGGLFVDPRGEAPLTRIYEEFVGESYDPHQLRHDKKLMLMETELAADVERLTELFATLCESSRDFRDFTRLELRDALKETIACFPVYRTYVSPVGDRRTDQDTSYVMTAIKLAGEQRPDLDQQLLGFLSEILLLEVDDEIAVELALRFQQTTGPVMAKGVEDTMFYVYNRFVALNEVGGDPGRFGVSLDEFHRVTAQAQERWPLGMLATSTHDTKRSEDVRARLALLSEIPERWGEAVARWSEMNEPHRREGWPDRNVEYLLYQTLVGAWPLDAGRATAYMEKAAKEAKVHTSWIDPDPAYDAALRGFVEGALADEAFTTDLAAFAEPLVKPGAINALSQTLVKLTAPGVPDTYQGTEVWDLSLVDPDNRRPVDHAQLRSLVAELREASSEDALTLAETGAPKLFVMQRALRLRARLPHAFGADSSYQALRARGPRAEHVIAFARGGEVVTVARRLVLGCDTWEGTTLELPNGTWRDEFSGRAFEGVVALSDLLSPLPVTLLVRETAEQDSPADV